MWTTAKIRRQLARMDGNEPFSIREFLIHGPRAAVDQAFARLVKNLEIVRVARGLYIKWGSPPPSVLEVAQVKAAAFRRTIVSHGAVAVARLKLDDSVEGVKGEEHLFATSGRSSSFRFRECIIRFVGSSARKLFLGDSKSGLAIRSLWHIGRQFVTMYMASAAIAPFGRTDREEFAKHADLMPEWMRDCFFAIERYWLGRQNKERQNRSGAYSQRSKWPDHIARPRLPLPPGPDPATNILDF